MTTATDELTVRSEVGRYTVAKSFIVDARSITAFAAGVGDFNECYMDDARDGGLIGHPGMTFSFQWNSRFTPDVQAPLALVRRGVHAWVDTRFERPIREGDVITSQGQSVAVRQVKPGVLSTQRYVMRDSSGQVVAVMDSGGITRGARLDGPEQEIEAAPELPQRSSNGADPVWSVEVPIDPQAPHIYTECADIWNPIHTERRVAIAAGLPDIILHGSANITIALREVINRSFGADPTTLRRFAGQFRGMVIPGRPVTVRATEVREAAERNHRVLRNAQRPGSARHRQRRRGRQPTALRPPRPVRHSRGGRPSQRELHRWPQHSRVAILPQQHGDPRSLSAGECKGNVSRGSPSRRSCGLLSGWRQHSPIAKKGQHA